MVKGMSSENSGGIGSQQNGLQGVTTGLLCEKPLVRAGLTYLLAGTAFTVVEAPHAEPSLHLIDAADTSEQVLDTVRSIKSEHPLSKVALLGSEFDPDFVLAASAAGVDGFCSTTSRREVLIKSLELIMLGEKMIPGALVHALLSQAPKALSPVAGTPGPHSHDAKVSSLSPRERVILQAIMGGDPNKVIARKLDVAEATVKVHVKAILRKVGAANRTQAAMWAAGHLAEVGSSPDAASGSKALN